MRHEENRGREAKIAKVYVAGIGARLVSREGFFGDPLEDDESPI